uniref:Fe-S Cluster Assembly Scaffold Protein n=1 Tax=Florenciella sp. virus SA2 TaxID=3240092 RepID=A0AB39JBD5_9VIRU
MKKEVITISKNAYNKIFEILKNNNKKHIEFYLKGGGCNGFNYQLIPTDDLTKKNYEIVKMKDFNVYVCNSSLLHLLGTHIDWTEDIMESKFVFDNPMAKSQCGCGTSFSSKHL